MGHRVAAGEALASLLRNRGLEGMFDHVSTAGDACLKLVVGDGMPGLGALEE
jgi:3-phosphoglycerate kinase